MEIDLIIAFLATSLCLIYTKKFAIKFDLIDQPNERKLHVGAIPLVGGISISFSILLCLYIFQYRFEHIYFLMLSIFVLTVIGVIDDRNDISYKYRILLQVSLSLMMVYFTDNTLYQFGNIIGSGNIELSILAPFMTVIAVIALINAINMVDGVDGLLGSLVMNILLCLASLLAFYQHNLYQLCLIVVVSMVPYLLLNLGVLNKSHKVFMGDAGSTVLGFILIWILLSTTQGLTTNVMRPVTALWIIAVPIMDMASLIIFRKRNNKSPFKPDRYHLHHILQNIGMSNTQILILVNTISLFMSIIGILGEVYNVPEYYMFPLFIFSFGLYFKILTHYRNHK